MDIVELRLDKLLEDTEKTLQLAVGDDGGRPAHEESLPKTHEGGDVTALLPESRKQKWAKKSLVLLWELIRRVELEQLRQNLEDVWDELGDVLSEDDLSRAKQSGLELRQSRGGALTNEADQASDTLKAVLIEFGVRWVLADFTEDVNEPAENSRVDGRQRLASGDDNTHGALY